MKNDKNNFKALAIILIKILKILFTILTICNLSYDCNQCKNNSKLKLFIFETTSFLFINAAGGSSSCLLTDVTTKGSLNFFTKDLGL